MAIPLWIQVINAYRRALDNLSKDAAREMLNAWERAGNNVLSDMESLARFLQRLDDRDRVNVSALRRMERYQRLLGANRCRDAGVEPCLWSHPRPAEPPVCRVGSAICS